MSVGVLLVSHMGIAEAMLENAESVLGDLPLNTRTLQIDFDSDTKEALQAAQALAGELDSGDGVLMLVDIMGATPCNLLGRIQANKRIITGLNLPMLMKLYNYADRDLDSLATLVIEGGCRGITEYGQQQ